MFEAYEILGSVINTPSFNVDSYIIGFKNNLYTIGIASENIEKYRGQLYSIIDSIKFIDNVEEITPQPTKSATAVPTLQPTATPTIAPTLKPTTKPVQNVPTEYKSALNKAKTYSDMMNMSKKGIYDQLVSEYGENFSAEAAQYAVDNLNADYNKNALEKAKTYRDTMDMSPNAIREQLVSEYGEQFTEEEADYAISHLD